MLKPRCAADAAVPMPRNVRNLRKESPARSATMTPTNGRHEHRTAKVVELIGSSRRSFDEAIRNALADAAETTRSISGAQVANMSLKCQDGRILEYKVDLRVAFGVERTRS